MCGRCCRRTTARAQTLRPGAAARLHGWRPSTPRRSTRGSSCWRWYDARMTRSRVGGGAARVSPRGPKERGVPLFGSASRDTSELAMVHAVCSSNVHRMHGSSSTAVHSSHGSKEHTCEMAGLSLIRVREGGCMGMLVESSPTPRLGGIWRVGFEVPKLHGLQASDVGSSFRALTLSHALCAGEGYAAGRAAE